MTINPDIALHKRVAALERALKRALARIRALEKRPAQVVTVDRGANWRHCS